MAPSITKTGRTCSSKWLRVCGFKFTANAGKATVYGAELEVAVVLVPGFVLSQNVGYTHATNSTTLPAAGVVSGERLLDVPEVTANTALELQAAVGE